MCVEKDTSMHQNPIMELVPGSFRPTAEALQLHTGEVDTKHANTYSKNFQPRP